MPENTRVRVEPDIEQYLKSQSERVLGKPVELVTGSDLTTLTNRLLYEHRVASQMAKQVPFAKLSSWVMGLVPSSGNKVVSLSQQSSSPALKPQEPDSFDFDAELGELYAEDAA